MSMYQENPVTQKMDTDLEASLKEVITTTYNIRYEARFLAFISGRKVEQINRRMKERKGRLTKAPQTISD